jgi:hypothetical protein
MSSANRSMSVAEATDARADHPLPGVGTVLKPESV